MSAFSPRPPRSLDAAGVPPPLLAALLLKALYAEDGASGAALAARVCLPTPLVFAALDELKARKLLVATGTPLVAGDYRYTLTDAGMSRADLLRRRGSWSSAAPVAWKDWLAAVAAQSVRSLAVRPLDLLAALDDLEIDRALLRRLGMATASGRTVMLYGPPGNGKTSIAERVVRAWPGGVWIPRVVHVGGHLVRVFDSKVHRAAPPPTDDEHDARWVYCERPTVLVGGELELAMLDLRPLEALGVAEAPLQMKAAGGALVVDDLGRQRVTPEALLNRWIVPLDRGVDHLLLPDGAPLQIPFDPFVVFSTNLDPRELADEAFLRRIPFKLEVGDPSPATFRMLLQREATRHGLALPDEVVAHLLGRFAGRPLRSCQPRDLMRLAAARQRYLGGEPTVTAAAIDDVYEASFLA